MRGHARRLTYSWMNKEYYQIQEKGTYACNHLSRKNIIEGPTSSSYVEENRKHIQEHL